MRRKLCEKLLERREGADCQPCESTDDIMEMTDRDNLLVCPDALCKRLEDEPRFGGRKLPREAQTHDLVRQVEPSHRRVVQRLPEGLASDHPGVSLARSDRNRVARTCWYTL